MAQSVAKLSIFLDDDIITPYVSVLSDADGVLTLRVRGIHADTLTSASAFLMKSTAGGQLTETPLALASVEHETVTFTRIGTPVTGDAPEYVSVDYKKDFQFRTITEEEVVACQREATLFNSAQRSGIADRLRKSITAETPQMQLIIRFMLEMDAKLDRIIEHIAPRETDSSLLNGRFVDIGGGSFRFFTTEILHTSALMYLQTEVLDTGAQFRFATVARITGLRTFPKGSIVTAAYEKLDEETRDEVIRFIFSREREFLKSIKV